MINRLNEQGIYSKIGIFAIILFAVFRPLTLMVGDAEIIGANILQLFAVGMSYFLLISVLISCKHIKIDRTSTLLIIFCFYCIISIAWGSKIDVISRILLPFILFFSMRIFITNTKILKILLAVLITPFIIPICISIYQIIIGQNIGIIEHKTGIIRYRGVFLGTHQFAYSMLFFSFIYSIVTHLIIIKSRSIKMIISTFFIVSIFCLYKTYTRTALFGLAVFWLVNLWGKRKKIFLLMLFVLYMGISMQYNKIEKIVWRSNKEYNLNTASSGRLEIWKHNFELFLKSDICDKLIGTGLRRIRSFHGENVYWSPHNDYLRLMLQLGLIGLLLYLNIIFSIIYDIYNLSEKSILKFLFAGIVASVFLMNFVSNAIIFRVELSQYFWMIMGLFYSVREMINQKNYETTTNKRLLLQRD